MLIYTIEHNPGQGPFVQKRLHIRGKADATQWERLQTVFFDSLNSCDHLIVNIENVDEYDYSFTMLICSTRRNAQLLGKRLTIEGKETDSFPCMYAFARHEPNRTCSFSRCDPCYLEESCCSELPKSAGKQKRPPSPGKHRRVR